MKKIRLGETGLQVAPVCLGTMYYGLDRMDEAASCHQMERYIAAGGDFIDTAQVYNNWVPGETSRSEKVIGRFLQGSGARDQVRLCTKGGHPLLDGRMVPRLRERELLDDLHRSLDNLKTDHVELYLLHRDDPSMPVADILGVLDAQAKAGLIRHYGCSNWTLRRVREARDVAARQGLAGFTVNQILWSQAAPNAAAIEDRTLVPMSDDFLRFHAETGMAAMAYSSQAQGYFSKRISGAPLSEKCRRMYDSPENEATLAALTAECARTGMSPAAATLAWITDHPFPAVPIVSCSNDAQLDEVMELFDRA